MFNQKIQDMKKIILLLSLFLFVGLANAYSVDGVDKDVSYELGIDIEKAQGSSLDVVLNLDGIVYPDLVVANSPVGKVYLVNSYHYLTTYSIAVNCNSPPNVMLTEYI